MAKRCDNDLCDIHCPKIKGQILVLGLELSDALNYC